MPYVDATSIDYRTMSLFLQNDTSTSVYDQQFWGDNVAKNRSVYS